MKQKRIESAVTAAVMGIQLLTALPVTAVTVPDAAAPDKTLEAFAEQICAVTQADADKTFYDTVSYDPAAGTLSADGTETGFCGDLTVRGGRLMIASAAPDSRYQTAGTIRSFDDAAEEYGYKTEQDGERLTVTNEFQTARLIVKSKKQPDSHGAQSAAEGYNDLHIFQYATTAQAYAAYQLYQQDPDIEYVQPSHILRIDPMELNAAADSAVTDLKTGSYMTWGADLIGTEHFYNTYLKDKELPEVKVAVIDTGLNTAPELFKGRVLDGGINFSGSGDDSIADDLSHGTHVAGTICELTPDNVKILPIKSFSKDGSASEEQIYAGIMYALENGADVLNMSFGGLGVNALEVEAMMIAEENGIICCASAGNNADDARYYYPSSIKSCITVAAVDEDMSRADFSNYGEMLDVSAPGVNIRSYGIENAEKLESKNGTSMAVPHVTACCALLCSYDPAITSERAENLLCLNATDLGEPGFDDDTGWGLVCMKDFRWDDGICKAPVFSKKAGNYGTEQTITLTAESPDMQIYYTLDGSMPDKETGTLYTEPFVITESTRVIAIAVKENYADSVPAEAVYTIGGKDIAGSLVIEDGVVISYTGIRQTVTIPETTEDGMYITAIGKDAFAGNRAVQTVRLPDTVTEIGEGAFRGCVNLESVTAPGVRTVGAEAFADDAALHSAALHADADTIGTAAFAGCSMLESMELMKLAALPERCFADCVSLEKLTIPSVTAFGEKACQNCAALDDVILDWRKVTALGNSCFAGCTAWTGNLILDGLETIGTGVFAEDKALLRVTLPASVTDIPRDTFSNCSGLRLLELPGAEVLHENAIALGSCRDDFTLVLDYGRIKQIGTNAFSGARLGNGFDTVTFSALEKLDFRSFGGVVCGILDLPRIKEVPRFAFASATLYGVVLEHAEKLGSESLAGAKAVKLSAAATDIAADAIPAETYIVTNADLPAPEGREDIKICQEPLVMRLNTHTLSLTQHTYGEFRITALGEQLTYQWYRTDGEQAEAIEGETAPVFSPESGTPGEFTYRCVITDADGKTEQVDCKTAVSELTEYIDLVPDDTPFYSDGTQIDCYMVTVTESGSYRLEVTGEAPATGVLTDENGNLCGKLEQQADHSAALTAELNGLQCYYLQVQPRWQQYYSLLLTNEQTEKKPFQDCTVTLIPTAFGQFDSEWHPPVRVVSPDGTELKEDTDYAVKVTQRNMHYQLNLFGIGAYKGSQTIRTDVIDRVPADTPIPVTLSGKTDHATVLFIPEETGTYYFYGSIDPRFQTEWANYLSSGSMRKPLYSNIAAACIVSSKPDGEGTVYAQSAFTNFNDGQFCDSVKLNAGQMYYLTCAIRDDRNAAFSLVISQKLRDIREAELDGNFFAVYRNGMSYEPEIELTYEGEPLKEGEDYLVLHSRNDIPGSANLLLVGTGLFIGKVTRSYEIIFPTQKIPETTVPLGEATTVSCETEKYQTVWFRADQAADQHTNARYRILNESVSGGSLEYQVYRLDEQLKTLSLMQAMPDDKNDYLLKNGLYCIEVFRRYSGRGGKTNITAVMPYALQEAEMTITDAVYTGGAVEAPVRLTVADGTVLQPGRDYIVAYAEENANVMFGEVEFTLRSTKYSYGNCTGTYQIVVQLPDEAPELTIGEHAVPLTKKDRIAWYTLTADAETHFLLASEDIPDIVLRVFDKEAEMTEQCYGAGIKALSFTVPAGETRYIMVKYNGLDREGTLHFRLDTEQRSLSDCTYTADPVLWTGEPVKPDIQIKDGETVLVEGTDYVQRYIVDDTDIGTATINYIGRGKYVGMLDVQYPIIMDAQPIREMSSITAPELEIPVKPMMLDYEYTVKNTEDNRYLIFTYYSALETTVQLSVYDARCKLSVQMYDMDGKFIGDEFITREGKAEAKVSGGEAVIFLFSATDISSSNQQWTMQLTDLDYAKLPTFEDKENGVIYRMTTIENPYDPDNPYEFTEAYRILPGTKNCRFERSVDTGASGIREVTDIQPGIFAALPKSAVVTASRNSDLTRYADYYHFLLLPLPYSFSLEMKPGDLNMDDKFTEADAVLFSALLAEHPAIDAEWLNLDADLNENGVLDAEDLRILFDKIHAYYEEEWRGACTLKVPFLPWYTAEIPGGYLQG